MSAINSAYGRFPWRVVLAFGLVLVGEAVLIYYGKAWAVLRKRATPRRDSALAERHRGKLQRLAEGLKTITEPGGKAWAALRKRATPRRDSALAERHRRELQGLVERFKTITEPGRNDMALMIADLARNKVPEKQGYYDIQGARTQINLIASAFRSTLDVQTRQKGAFASAAQLSERLLWLWHYDLLTRLASNLRADLQAAGRELNLQEEDRYNRARKLHADLMDDFVRFARRVNADFGERILRVTYYESLPDLR